MLGNWQPDRAGDLRGLVAAGPVSRFPGGGPAQTQGSLACRAPRIVDITGFLRSETQGHFCWEKNTHEKITRRELTIKVQIQKMVLGDWTCLELLQQELPVKRFQTAKKRHSELKRTPLNQQTGLTASRQITAVCFCFLGSTA